MTVIYKLLCDLVDGNFRIRRTCNTHDSTCASPVVLSNVSEYNAAGHPSMPFTLKDPSGNSRAITIWPG